MSTNLSDSNHAVVNSWCHTQSQLDEVDFTWTISNFSFHEAEGVGLKSSKFSAVTNDKIKWYLKCKPTENKKKDTISVILFWFSDTDQLEKVFAKFTISILNVQLESKIIPLSCAHLWGWSRIIRKDQNFQNELSRNDELTIRCNVKFTELKKVQTSFHQSKPDISTCSLSTDLALLFENQEFSDVVISVNGKDYRAHKIILAARSPVFAAMFRHNMKETKQNRVVIEDTSEDVMGEILRYIYTGKCKNLEKFAEELLAAADKYSLDSLKAICVGKLPKLSVENASNMLVLADLHGVDGLKVDAMKFIVSQFTEVSNTTGWKTILSNPRLVDEVFQAFARRCGT